MSEPHEVERMLKQVKYDLSVTQSRVDEALKAFGKLNLTPKDAPQCPVCGIGFQHKLVRDEHLYNTHDGPVPEHYLAAERLAGIEAS